MSDDLLRYYTVEYAALSRLAAEFANNHPDHASALRLDRDRVDDPHVERLLEGVAFLGARVQQRLDDEATDFAETLLGALYPNMLAPFPSCMTAQLTPRADLRGPAIVPRLTAVETEPVNGIPCRYRTTADTVIWPVEIQQVRLAGLPLPSLPGAPRGAAGTLRISLRCIQPETTFEQLGVDKLRFHLRGAGSTPIALYRLLCNNALQVSFADGPADPRPVIRPASAITPGGFEPSEAILPWPAHGFAGFRLLTEYFGYPAKFLYIDIGGIDGKSLAGAGRTLEIIVYLDRVPPELLPAVDGALALGCVPMVNLFEQACDPVSVDWTATEYRVDPDPRRTESLEVWSVERVREARTDGTLRPWRPFFRMTHGDGDGDTSGGYYQTARRSAAGLHGGTDLVLLLDDPAFQPDRSAPATLSIDSLCTNRNLPRRLATGDGRPGLRLVEGSTVVAAISALGSPSEAQRHGPRIGRLWQLVSHLSLNHLSLVGGAQAAATLREVLRLHDRRDDTSTQAMIASLVDVAAEAGAARLPGARPGVFCRGIDVRMTFDPQAWSGSGPYLLASVLERFLALHATVNGFVRCTAYVAGGADVAARWQPRAGTRLLL